MRDIRSQRGAGLLGTVSAIAAIVVVVQATVYYQSKSGHDFLSREKGKILAQQAAEAGVEQTVADLGSRTLRLNSSMNNYSGYSGRAVGEGSFSTRLTARGLGAAGDTVDLTSTGTVGLSSSSVQARLKLKLHIDTVRTAISAVHKETTYAYSWHTRPDTTIVPKVRNPNTMPALNATPAYSSCMSSGAKKCDICHLPGGDPSMANVVSVSKSSIDTHIDHHGDYVTTDHTCDLYKPKPDTTIATVNVLDTTRNIVDHTVYDTVVSADTLMKIKFLSWK